MALVRWEPLREMDTLQQEMNRLFDRFVTVPYRNGLNSAISGSYVPAAELEDTPEALHLRLEVPGLAPEDIDIQVTADAVTITGERKSETHTEEEGYKRTEFRYGKFQRVIPLPVQVENKAATASYTNGILNLVLPKAEDERHKVVKVAVS